MEELRIDEAAFWARVERRGTCWIWRGAREQDGYGCLRLRRGGRSMVARAHRVAYGLAHGEMPRPDQIVCHRCDTRLCVRPDHLVLGSHADNVRHRVERGRSARAERNGRAKLALAAVEEIRQRLAQGEPIGAIARAHGVCPRTIRNIRDGVTWRPAGTTTPKSASAG